MFVDSFVDDLTYVRDVKVCMEGMVREHMNETSVFAGRCVPWGLVFG